MLRIVGHARYPNAPGMPAQVVEILVGSRRLPGHRFWPADLNLVDDRVDTSRLLTSAQVTDTYLLALAQANGGRLASFDRRLVVDAVKGGAAALTVI